MRLINQTRDTVLAEDIYLAGSFLKRVKGLLGRKEFLPGQGLILEPCNSVHTFFMRFPIDLLFVDNNYRIIKALPEFLPNRISRIFWRSRLVIELPRGVLKLTKTHDKDQLLLEKNYGPFL